MGFNSAFKGLKGKGLYARSKNCEMRLPALSFMLVCMSERNNTASAGRIFMKIDV